MAVRGSSLLLESPIPASGRSTASLSLDNVYVRAWQGKMRVANPCPYWEDMERYGHSLRESSRNLN
ncbi:hypothetical protein EYF80_003325 [Liparis tanakae]|uniref:Uncharacterized protein n=1 Tax=Liparis tanakae TaxID=230148 RepID=A0A4Z2J862_9TELE|nr:hypothetical protein EYF80_003325 [Liparis tanakae]